MSKKTLVTSNQTDAVRDMANAKGVTRVQFQSAQDDGRIARFLDTLKIDQNQKVVMSTQDPRIHIVRVKVKLDRPWQEAVNAAGPNTPNNYNVRKVGDLYLPTGTDEVEEELIMVNYPKGDGYDKALAWAKTQGLENTVPREVFAIGEQHPNLHIELGVNPMYAVSTTECSFEGDRSACFVWWHDSAREASLHWVSSFDDSHDWFVFRKSALKTKKL